MCEQGAHVCHSRPKLEGPPTPPPQELQLYLQVQCSSRWWVKGHAVGHSSWGWGGRVTQCLLRSFTSGSINDAQIDSSPRKARSLQNSLWSVQNLRHFSLHPVFPGQSLFFSLSTLNIRGSRGNATRREESRSLETIMYKQYPFLQLQHFIFIVF